jgi:hypothetical protein
LKDQYFGDVNDYRKYGLLRGLAGGGGCGIAVCWMLTGNDGRGDGNRRGYLGQPDRWQGFDRDLFAALRACRRRSVGEAERRGIVPGAAYFGRRLTDAPDERARYFAEFLRAARGRDLVFFDPDNGLEVDSVPRGRKGSGKYLYRDELARTFAAGHSVLVYQHYPRVERRPYARRLAGEVGAVTGAAATWTFSTPSVLFLLAAQARHRELLAGRAAALGAGPWASGARPQFRVAAAAGRGRD